jgi:hypothetical protein
MHAHTGSAPLTGQIPEDAGSSRPDIKLRVSQIPRWKDLAEKIHKTPDIGKKDDQPDPFLLSASPHAVNDTYRLQRKRLFIYPFIRECRRKWI